MKPAILRIFDAPFSVIFSSQLSDVPPVPAVVVTCTVQSPSTQITAGTSEDEVEVEVEVEDASSKKVTSAPTAGRWTPRPTSDHQPKSTTTVRSSQSYFGSPTAWLVSFLSTGLPPSFLFTSGEATGAVAFSNA